MADVKYVMVPVDGIQDEILALESAIDFLDCDNVRALGEAPSLEPEAGDEKAHYQHMLDLLCTLKAELETTLAAPPPVDWEKVGAELLRAALPFAKCKTTPTGERHEKCWQCLVSAHDLADLRSAVCQAEALQLVDPSNAQ